MDLQEEFERVRTWCNSKLDNEDEKIDANKLLEESFRELEELVSKVEDELSYEQFIECLGHETNQLLATEVRGTWKEYQEQWFECLSMHATKLLNNEYFEMKFIFVVNQRTEERRAEQLIEESNNGAWTDFDYCYFQVNNDEYDIRTVSEEENFRNEKQNIINIRFLPITILLLKNCHNLAFLDISHTFISHIDTRELIEIRELYLANTNIQRVSLANQRGLVRLACNYTQIAFISLLNMCELECLECEYCGQLKLGRLIKACNLFFDNTQVMNTYERNAKLEERHEESIIYYPLPENNEPSLEIYVSDKHNELITRGMKECLKIEISGLGEELMHSFIANPINIFNFSNVNSVFLNKIKFFECIINSLPAIVEVWIMESEIHNIVIEDLPLLRKLIISSARFISSVLTNLPSLSELNIENTNIYISDISTFTALKYLSPNNEALIQQAQTLKELKMIDLKNVHIPYLSIVNIEQLGEICGFSFSSKRLVITGDPLLRSVTIELASINDVMIYGLPLLERLYAFGLKCKRFEITNLPELSILGIRNINVFIPNVTEFKNLTELGTTDERIIDLFRNGENPGQLKILNISASPLTNIVIDGLFNLERLYIHRTNITEIDLANFKKLEKVCASTTCKILNYDGEIERLDKNF